MDVSRAREIINSDDKITVTYDGKSVWINSINPNTKQAFVENLDDNHEHHNVPITDLLEQ